MKKTPVEKILNELGKMKEYYYPIGCYSLFILPDGRMVGTCGLIKHQSIFEKILKLKLTGNKEFINILVDIRCVKIIISERSLYVDVVTAPTMEQKSMLEELGTCGKYNYITTDTMRELVPDAPSMNYCRRLLKLPFKP